MYHFKELFQRHGTLIALIVAGVAIVIAVGMSAQVSSAQDEADELTEQVSELKDDLIDAENKQAEVTSDLHDMEAVAHQAEQDRDEAQECVGTTYTSFKQIQGVYVVNPSDYGSMVSACKPVLQDMQAKL